MRMIVAKRLITKRGKYTLLEDFFIENEYGNIDERSKVEKEEHDAKITSTSYEE